MYQSLKASPPANLLVQFSWLKSVPVPSFSFSRRRRPAHYFWNGNEDSSIYRSRQPRGSTTEAYLGGGGGAQGARAPPSVSRMGVVAKIFARASQHILDTRLYWARPIAPPPPPPPFRTGPETDSTPPPPPPFRTGPETDSTPPPPRFSYRA